MYRDTKDNVAPLTTPSDHQSSMYHPLASGASKTHIVLIACFLLTISACDRPFVPPNEPAINIITPRDPEALRLNPNIEIRVEATSFREISRVEIEGQPLAFDSTAGNWFISISLSPGINELDITAYDIEDVPGTKTLFITYLDPEFTSGAPTFPSPWRLGGHTATLLNDGSVLVTGGAPSTFQNAVSQAFILPPEGSEFEPLTNGLNTPRYGHTATLLPDGRVLMLGGSSTSAPANTSHLVDTAEIFDPSTREFKPIPFNVSPLMRAEHVTFVTRGPATLFVDVYGGLGHDPRSETERLEPMRNFLTFHLENDMLTSFGSFTDIDIQPAYGMAAALLTGSGASEMGRYIVSGSRFLESGAENINFSIDFDSSPIRVVPLNELLTPRIQHASATLRPGLIAVFGGFQGDPKNATSSTEIFVEINDRFSSIDTRTSSIRRFAHTATKLKSDRILILGGFSETGQAIDEAEYFEWGF